MFRLLGLLYMIIYKLKYGSKVCFKGIPLFVAHFKIYAKSGKMCVGKNFRVNQGTYIAVINKGEIIIGDNVSLNRNCTIVSHDSIVIGNNVAIGPNVVFYDHDHNFDKTGIIPGYKTGPIVIGNHVWIGAGATILRDTIIGEGSVIGAGCIVQGVIPSRSLVTSNRALNVVPIKDKE